MIIFQRCSLEIRIFVIFLRRCCNFTYFDLLYYIIEYVYVRGMKFRFPDVVADSIRKDAELSFGAESANDYVPPVLTNIYRKSSRFSILHRIPKYSKTHPCQLPRHLALISANAIWKLYYYTFFFFFISIFFLIILVLLFCRVKYYFRKHFLYYSKSGFSDDMVDACQHYQYYTHPKHT